MFIGGKGIELFKYETISLYKNNVKDEFRSKVNGN